MLRSAVDLPPGNAACPASVGREGFSFDERLTQMTGPTSLQRTCTHCEDNSEVASSISKKENQDSSPSSQRQAIVLSRRGSVGA